MFTRQTTTIFYTHAPRMTLLLFLLSFHHTSNAQNDSQLIFNNPENSNSSSRIQKDTDQAVEADLENTLSFTLELPAFQITSCQATIAIAYHQRNILARVESTIEDKSCAASTGEYEVAMSIRNDNGETQRLVFNETWQQSDYSKVIFIRDYPIGENMELLRISTRKSRCACMTQPAP